MLQYKMKNLKAKSKRETNPEHVEWLRYDQYLFPAEIGVPGGEPLTQVTIPAL